MPHVDKKRNDLWRVNCVLYNAAYDPHAANFLYWLWDRMHKEDLMDVYSHNSSYINFPAFVRLFTSPTEFVLLVSLVDVDGKPQECMGFAVLSDLKNGAVRSGIGAFCFFREYADRDLTMRAGVEVLRKWFMTPDVGLDVVVGATPEDNHAAIRYIKRLGFTIGCTIPGLHIYKGVRGGGVISYMTKDEFKKLHGGT